MQDKPSTDVDVIKQFSAQFDAAASRRDAASTLDKIANQLGVEKSYVVGVVVKDAVDLMYADAAARGHPPRVMKICDLVAMAGDYLAAVTRTGSFKPVWRSRCTASIIDAAKELLGRNTNQR